MRFHSDRREPLPFQPLHLALALFLCVAPSACIPDGDAGEPDTEVPDAGAGDEPGAEGEAYLAAHNTVRAEASPTPSPALAPLTWSAQAVGVAQAWADNCRFEHNAGRGNLGENLSASTREDAPAQVVEAWSSEAPDYDYAQSSCAAGKVCGHYTQLVWRETQAVGCASARCTRDSPFSGFSTWYLYVCNYAPPGNFVGERPY